jgi:hypothetical protein
MNVSTMEKPSDSKTYDYARKVHSRFPDVPKMADFCVHWFELAHNALSAGGRAGLVGRNRIRENESRQASLDYVVQNGGTIIEAVSTEVWSGEAAVHVSIVNWLKGTAEGKKLLMTQIGDAVDDPWRIEELDVIPPTLSSRTDVTSAVPLSANRKPKLCFQGQNPVNDGFFLSPDEAAAMIRGDSRNREVLFPYMIGRDLVEEYGPTRWIVDFGQRDQFQARAYQKPWERVAQYVMTEVLTRAEKEKQDTGKLTTRWSRMAQRWWQFRDYQPGLMSRLSSLHRYIECSRTTRRSIFEFVSPEVHPDTKLAVVLLEDDYSFGVIQSEIHWVWVLGRCSTWKADFNYTGTTVFDTFPWPQEPTREQIKAVAEAAVALRLLRRETMRKLNYSLRDLYRTLEQPGDNPLRSAHSCLDAAVRAAYGMADDADPLAFLLELNLACAAKEQKAEKVTAPGLPLPDEDRGEFVTNDCIEPPR